MTEAAERLSTDQSLLALCLSGAETLDKAGKTDDAVKLLRIAIGVVPADGGLFVLYLKCAEMLDRVGKTDKSVELLRAGIEEVPSDCSLSMLYQSCADMLGRDGELDQVVELLKTGIEAIPLEHGLFCLHQSCAKSLLGDVRMAETMARLSDGIRDIPLIRSDRYRLIDYILLYAAATMDGDGVDPVVDPCQETAAAQQMLLGRVLRKELDGDWTSAVAVAREGRKRFPTYALPADHEALCLLGLGEADAAKRALDSFSGALGFANPNRWLKAFISLRLGDSETAAETLSAFLGRPLVPDETPTEEMLLRIWDNRNYLKERNAVAFRFPILPPAMTGLPDIAVRLPYGPPVLPKTVTDDLKEVQVLVTDRDGVFISYSHKDSEWLQRLKTHLKPYERAGTVSVWSDEDIEMGADWREEIEKALAKAKVAVLLVSADFLDSDFIDKNELPPLLDAAKSKGLTVAWVPIRPSSYRKTEIAKYQSAWSPDKPLSKLSEPEQDEALVAICEKIEKAANP